MSNWTHVAGIVRIDCLKGLQDEPDFEQLFGKELRYDDPVEKWADSYARPQDFLPMGSEGSLRMSVWINPNKSHLAAYTVSIFGDLRDHENPDEIVDWLEKKCSSVNEKLMIRNACAVVESDFAGTRTWLFQKE